MQHDHISHIAGELNLAPGRVRAVAGLLENGGTIPFIARYRKEATGSLDEVAIRDIRDRLKEFTELEKRKNAILQSLAERELLTPELRAALERANSRTVLEDIYLPYRPKRRTKASIAREKGLGPLAERIMEQKQVTLNELVKPYVDPDKGIASADEALEGARDIIAEQISVDIGLRKKLRKLFWERSRIHSRLKRGKSPDSEASKYRDYFQWEESSAQAPGHRILAMFRGEREGCLSVFIRPDEERALEVCLSMTVRGRGPCQEQVALAVREGYKRLLAPSLENELRDELKGRADSEAIQVFASNLRELLLAPPLGQKRVMALDPGYRSGAKLVCMDEQGQLLHTAVIFPTGSDNQVREAEKIVRNLAGEYAIEAIAVGNGTAGRETETFVRSLNLPGVAVVMVNESGASVYSASEQAREEFPDLDLTMRSAVSIGRRLMDPLAELVKIDPKAIGVGQYQHDVDQTALKRALDDTVISCVNKVGVELNTASAALLSYVAGVGPGLAKNMESWRLENGPFQNRKDLLQVKRFGPKAFEQAAGFLRITKGTNPLESSGVHPERYPLVERMAGDLGVTVTQLMGDPSLPRRIELERYVSDAVGLETLTDIRDELIRPGRDPRPAFEPFSFAEGITSMDDLEPGMRVPGVVTNVTRFGVFIDIGVHQDGLAHISQLADRFVRDPGDVVTVGQKVQATILEVDKSRKRISLSLK